MNSTSIFALIINCVLVFAISDYSETKHSNEYQRRKENIEVEYYADVTKCESHSSLEYDQCATEAEISRNASMVELYIKYKECSSSKKTCLET
jgi:hypothetical protein